MDILTAVTLLSHEFGTAEYVKGGGGNTSAKNGSSLWVKPSGTTLEGLQPNAFVEVDRERLGLLYSICVPADAQKREALVKEMMEKAVRQGQAGRPSVEAPLHDVLEETFVVHTHPALVNGMTCSLNGREACEKLFPDALWVPYVDPGFSLCMDVRRRVREYAGQRGRTPAVLFLQNHGVFVTGDAVEEVRGHYGKIMETLKRVYRSAGLQECLAVTPAAGNTVMAEIQRLVATDGWVVVCGGNFKAVKGPISPDHIVYSKAFPYEGDVTADGLEAFRRRWGYTPQVFVTNQGVYAAGPTIKKAALSLELARDGALVGQLAEAFGGVRFLDDRQREFIEQWEVESYRQKQM